MFGNGHHSFAMDRLLNALESIDPAKVDIAITSMGIIY